MALVVPYPLSIAVGTSRKFGRRTFPGRADYERALSMEPGAPGTIEDSPDVAAAVLRHWHTTGQTGCLFARMLGRKATADEWPTFVMPDAADESAAASDLEALRETILACVRDRNVQLLSVALPRVVTVSQLKDATIRFNDAAVIRFFEDRDIAGQVRVAGRVEIIPGVVAWVMAFGPFDDWPPTRQGPVLEFVIRTKPKRSGLFEKLNQDPSVAHLADIDLGLSPAHTSRLFDGTQGATRDVLAGEPDAFSAAKTTYSFSAATWDGAGSRELPSGSLASEADYPPEYADGGDRDE